MSTKHTPAPWWFAATAAAGKFHVGAGDMELAVVEMSALSRGYRADGTSEGNARLIAAAPDLLKAAQLALNQITALAPTLSTANYLRAAIAKARGES